MAHVLFYKIRRSKCVGVVMEHFEGVGLTWGWYIRMPYRELTLGSSFNYSKLTEWYVSFFFTLPSPSICKTAGHHSTKRAGELLAAENAREDVVVAVAPLRGATEAVRVRTVQGPRFDRPTVDRSPGKKKSEGKGQPSEE